MEASSSYNTMTHCNPSNNTGNTAASQGSNNTGNTQGSNSNTIAAGAAPSNTTAAEAAPADFVNTILAIHASDGNIQSFY